MSSGSRVDVLVQWRGVVVEKNGGWPSECSCVGSPSYFQGAKERLRRSGKGGGGRGGDGGEGGRGEGRGGGRRRREGGEEGRRRRGMALLMEGVAKGVAAVDGARGPVARHMA